MARNNVKRGPGAAPPKGMTWASVLTRPKPVNREALRESLLKLNTTGVIKRKKKSGKSKLTLTERVGAVAAGKGEIDKAILPHLPKTLDELRGRNLTNMNRLVNYCEDLLKKKHISFSRARLGIRLGMLIDAKLIPEVRYGLGGAKKKWKIVPRDMDKMRSNPFYFTWRNFGNPALVEEYKKNAANPAVLRQIEKMAIDANPTKPRKKVMAMLQRALSS